MTPEEEKEWDKITQGSIALTNEFACKIYGFAFPHSLKSYISQLLQQREKELVEKMLESRDLLTELLTWYKDTHSSVTVPVMRENILALVVSNITNKN